jgi:hypothetical protein
MAGHSLLEDLFKKTLNISNRISSKLIFFKKVIEALTESLSNNTKMLFELKTFNISQ